MKTVRYLSVALMSLAFTVPAMAQKSPVARTKKPRLGNFEFRRNATYNGKRADAIHGKMNLKLRHGKKYDRLEVRLDQPGSSKAPWKQTFVVQSDSVSADGTRKLTLVRPKANSRLEKNNEKRLNAFIQADDPRFSYDTVQGVGVLEITGKRVRWDNKGTAGLTIKGSVYQTPTSWIETYHGGKPMSPKAAQKVMNREWQRGIQKFTDSGGFLFAGAAAGGGVKGIHPKTGEKIHAFGNLKDGIVIRRTAANGIVRDLRVSSGGRLQSKSYDSGVRSRTIVVVE